MDINVMPLLKRGVHEVISEDALQARLQTGRPLIIKAGFDPSAPDLHLGHTLLLNKLKTFQELGHQVYFLIGNFTALIGDPTGKNVARRPLTAAEVKEYAKTYAEQAFKILDPAKTHVCFNAQWLDRLSSRAMIRLAARYTVARMLERDDFQKRYTTEQPIAIHEFLYPLLQGYDSAMLKADVELGGVDQLFNLLVGREIQKQMRQRPQVVMTLPLLEGLDGVRKMSKSYNNYIGINEAPDMIFGKIMSISDDLMWRYYELISFQPPEKIAHYQRAVAEGLNPRDVKVELAEEIVARFHGFAAAQTAHAGFKRQFQAGEMPEIIPDIYIEGAQLHALLLANLLKAAGLAASTSKALQLLTQGAVRIGGERIQENMPVAIGQTYIVQVGKRQFARIYLV